MKTYQQLIESVSVPKLDPSKRVKINNEIRLSGMDGNGRFDTVNGALFRANQILRKYSLEIVRFPAHIGDGDIEGQKGHFTTPLNWVENLSTWGAGEEIPNSVFVLSWEHLKGGIEVVAYCS